MFTMGPVAVAVSLPAGALRALISRTTDNAERVLEMTHMHLGRRPVRKLHGLLALWVTCVTSASAQTTGPVCTAVASSNNALYLVSQSGSLVSQLLTDSLPKLSVAIAPEANKVAY